MVNGIFGSMIDHINPFLTFPQEPTPRGEYPARKKPPESEVSYLKLSEGEPQVEVGESGGVLDKIGRVLAAPGKLLNFTGLDTNKNVSQDTIRKVEEYLQRNELDHIKVCVSVYNPKLEWKRTFANPRTMMITKLFSGTLNAMLSTIIPKKIAAINIYDQYTDTVTLNTNDLGMALFACAQAKATAIRKNPVLYNTVKDFMPTATPVGNLNCTLDVIEYLRKYGTLEEVEKATKTLSASSGIDFAFDVLYNPVIQTAALFGSVLMYGIPKPESFQSQMYGYMKTGAFVAFSAFLGYRYGIHKVSEFKKTLEKEQTEQAQPKVSPTLDPAVLIRG